MSAQTALALHEREVPACLRIEGVGLGRRLLSAMAIVAGLAASSANAQVALKALHTFDGADGARPKGGVILATDGNFYGTTSSGGANGKGSVFKMTRKGATTTMYSFSGSDGSDPEAALVQGSDGLLYGTTYGGGANGMGTVFRIGSHQALKTLHSFDGSDGRLPFASLVQGADGDFYGSTFFGGSNDVGALFKISGKGQFTLLNSFGPDNGGNPANALVLARDGNFYTTTFGNTAIMMTPAGDVTLLHVFESNEGIETAGLVQASDGAFYGTAALGGDFGAGTLFRMTSDGTVTVIHSFNGQNDGGQLTAPPMQATDGNLYGLTWEKAGTMYRMTLDGQFTSLYNFRKGKGAPPEGVLVQDAAGDFYGVTSGGGADGDGTVFKMSGVIQ